MHHVDTLPQRTRNGLDRTKRLLKNNGLAIIEVHYSRTIIDDINFDFIYHEHMTYYTVTSFNNICIFNDIQLENVEFTKIHGKSMRLYVRNIPYNYKLQNVV